MSDPPVLRFTCICGHAWKEVRYDMSLWAIYMLQEEIKRSCPICGRPKQSPFVKREDITQEYWKYRNEVTEEIGEMYSVSPIQSIYENNSKPEPEPELPWWKRQIDRFNSWLREK